jgi:hypothetical protein
MPRQGRPGFAPRPGTKKAIVKIGAERRALRNEQRKAIRYTIIGALLIQLDAKFGRRKDAIGELIATYGTTRHKRRSRCRARIHRSQVYDAIDYCTRTLKPRETETVHILARTNGWTPLTFPRGHFPCIQDERHPSRAVINPAKEKAGRSRDG